MFRYIGRVEVDYPFLLFFRIGSSVRGRRITAIFFTSTSPFVKNITMAILIESYTCPTNPRQRVFHSH